MKKQILYIDNDIASYILVSEILKDCNVKITHCKCGTSAILLFQKYPSFDLVITEIRLPKAGGFNVLNAIRSVKPNIPVIVQTASVLGNMKKRCLEAGFNEFVSKPFDLSQFVSMVNKYIQNTSETEL